MSTFVFGLLLIVIGIGAFIGRRSLAVATAQIAMIAAGALIVVVFGFGVMVWSTAIYVESDQRGVINVKFGADLSPGKVIAADGRENSPSEYPATWLALFLLAVVVRPQASAEC